LGYSLLLIFKFFSSKSFSKSPAEKQHSSSRSVYINSFLKFFIPCPSTKIRLSFSRDFLIMLLDIKN
jgi:hypothetical protein